MSEKLNKDDNSSKVINKEENDETEKNLNINNSLINSKCLLKELEEKWDKIEKNNSLNSLSLSEKKQSKNNSISSFKNIGITIKDIIKTKYKKIMKIFIIKMIIILMILLLIKKKNYKSIKQIRVIIIY